MTEHTPPDPSDDAAAPTGSASRKFESPERLRALLIRLHQTGPGAWRSDREAAELMRYTAARYRPLARKARAGCLGGCLGSVRGHARPLNAESL